MEYEKQSLPTSAVKFKPRLIIHGGAGNIIRKDYPPEKYQAYRNALLSIVSNTNDYMNSTQTPISKTQKSPSDYAYTRPSALDVATHAVLQLEDNPLFNSGHGAVFTRDGINELEASVMVSRGFKKRGVGVMGLRRVRNPILLARMMLEHGEQDLAPRGFATSTGSSSSSSSVSEGGVDVDVPSAQGHTQIHGVAAEKLAQQYGLEMVAPGYFFTQQRWDEHVRALEREKAGHSMGTWDAEEYLPQGTVGAVALDENGVVCAATSTGGMTNKLTGRIGDTPVVGAGFWAEEWAEEGDPTSRKTAWERLANAVNGVEPGISFTGPLQGLFADCLPTPWMYSPLDANEWQSRGLTTTRSIAVSGTGNGDSFIRINAVRTVAAMARWKPESGAKALNHVTGSGGELQKSAGDRWKRTGEGEGGMIGIESVIVRDPEGNIVDTRSEILMDYNCGGMYRAWIDNDGSAVMSIWSNGSSDGI